MLDAGMQANVERGQVAGILTLLVREMENVATWDCTGTPISRRASRSKKIPSSAFSQ
jgi:hypothetical protein